MKNLCSLLRFFSSSSRVVFFGNLVASPAHCSKWGPGRKTILIINHLFNLWYDLFIMYNSGLSFVWGSNLALSLERLRISLCSQQLQRWSDEKKSLELWLGLLGALLPSSTCCEQTIRHNQSKPCCRCWEQSTTETPFDRCLRRSYCWWGWWPRQPTQCCLGCPAFPNIVTALAFLRVSASKIFKVYPPSSVCDIIPHLSP